MNKIYLFLIALFLTITVSGQLSGQESYFRKGYIYLKNGSVIKGNYQYSNSLDKLRVISGKNTWVFDTQEVDRISRTKPGLVVEKDSVFPRQPLPVSKWFYIAETGILIGYPDDSQSAPAIFGSSVYRQAWKNLYAGAGVGVEIYKESYMPVTFNLLYKLRQTWFTPTWMVQAGYEIPVGKSRSLYYDVVPNYVYSSSNFIWQGNWPQSQSKLKATGGLILNPSMGFIMQSRSGLGFSMAFGYRFHRLHYTGENDYRIFIDYRRFSVKMGFIFK
jgi:hypothetical protein